MASQKYYKFMDAVRAHPQPDLPTISEERRNYEELCTQFDSGVDAVVESANADGVQAEWSTPPGANTERVIFYLHGGGYQMGSPLTHRGLVARIARAASARALSIDYRLAPEHRFPAAVEDTVAAYKWLRRQCIGADRITFAGDSAGGGLALATMVAVRDSGDTLPAAAVCMSPLTDLAVEGASMRTLAALDPFVQPKDIAAYGRRYLGQNSTQRRRSPLRCTRTCVVFRRYSYWSGLGKSFSTIRLVLRSGRRKPVWTSISKCGRRWYMAGLRSRQSSRRRSKRSNS